MKKNMIIAALAAAILASLAVLTGMQAEKTEGANGIGKSALSPCAGFEGEKKLCESAAENIASAFNGSVVYAAEKYADANYSDAWKIYIEMPFMVMDEKAGKSTNKMAFIFDKKTETIRFYDFVPLNG